MAQPHLGTRRGFLVRGVPIEVDVEQLAHQAGYSAVSRYGADVFCDLAGFDQLKLGPDVTLPLNALPMPLPTRIVSGAPRTHKYTIRIPDQVNAEELARRAGYSAVSRFARDTFCTLAGRSDLRLGPDLFDEGGSQLSLSA
ncbi:hypothetical protein [Williamsia sp. CHRR-6]|uniref:hypothetical protein n=1 Tax=Williamsia sp. CHRR-6 TaxID=2835871 RepID=UPI001BD9C9CF|nr:hypothetical protein [Williamsia sp. CHRR-6]MBT0568633.1 hypothetical protein [Williamsia sp. CHRR-6]